MPDPVDVVCVGSPFLDLIFRGLSALPAPGAEQLAGELVIVPGAMANVAFALGRLGLRAAICAPTLRTSSIRAKSARKMSTCVPGAAA